MLLLLNGAIAAAAAKDGTVAAAKKGVAPVRDGAVAAVKDGWQWHCCSC